MNIPPNGVLLDVSLLMPGVHRKLLFFCTGNTVSVPATHNGGFIDTETFRVIFDPPTEKMKSLECHTSLRFHSPY